ncbi:MAG: ferrous iron transporter B [Candidatus Korobacteraceae bacterium]|jgi:ferrous iron transport protein B
MSSRECCGPSIGTILEPAIEKKAIRTVAVVGPPNCGKTTVFNQLTGLNRKVANFPGVTVEHFTGYITLPNGERVALIDLPGIYSMNAKSEDERVTIDALRGRIEGMEALDAILLVLDSTNLGRHLALAAPVISLGLPTLVLLNMADSLRARQGSIDVLSLAQQLGTPVALVSAASGEGLEAVERFVNSTMPQPQPAKLPVLQDVRTCREWAERVNLQSNYQKPLPALWTRRLDAIFLDQLWGPLTFLVVVVAVFQIIFSAGQPLSKVLQEALDGLGNAAAHYLPYALARSLLIDGAWKGVSAVLVFLPQILLLFLLVGVLEDSGYLARAAVIADRTMSRFGLNGKAFIPLLSAYACAVPAIMATRTIENKRDRIATIMIAPFMTCSARLPVYTMVIAAFVPNRRLLGVFFSSRALAMLALYVIGFLAALFTARVLKSSVLKSKGVPFLLELPSYRWPTLRSLGLRLYDRAKAFVWRAGTVILAVSLLLAILTNLPTHQGQPPAIADSVAGRLGHTLEPVIAPLGFNWKIGVGLLTSVAAREVIVGTLGTLYGIDPGQHAQTLQEALRGDLTMGGAAALLIFFAFAMQCTSTLAVVRRETNSWKWPIAQFAYMTTLAYFGALIAKYAVDALVR